MKLSPDFMFTDICVERYLSIYLIFWLQFLVQSSPTYEIVVHRSWNLFKTDLLIILLNKLIETTPAKRNMPCLGAHSLESGWMKRQIELWVCVCYESWGERKDRKRNESNSEFVAGSVGGVFCLKLWNNLFWKTKCLYYLSAHTQTHQHTCTPCHIHTHTYTYIHVYTQFSNFWSGNSMTRMKLFMKKKTCSI